MDRQPKKPFVLPERNPAKHAKHRKEVFWQITFPVIIGALLLIAGIVALLVMTLDEAQDLQAMSLPENTVQANGITEEEAAMVYYQRSTTSRLSTVSQMWLTMPVIFFELLALVALVGLVYLFTQLLVVLPGYARIAQDFMALTALRVRHAMDMASEPFLRAKSAAAAARRVRLSAMQQASDVLGKIAGDQGE